MSAILPGSRKVFSTANFFGRLSLRLIVAVFCSAIALFAGAKAWHKLDIARPANVHKTTHLKTKRFVRYKKAGDTAHSAQLSIDYGGHAFTFGTGKTVSLTPISSGVGAASPGVYSGPVVLGTGLNFSQNGVALDAAGNIYVNDQDGGSGNVKKIAADGSSTIIIGTGFLTQSGNVAVDHAGNVYVTDQSRVWKIPVGGAPGTYDAPVIFNNTFTRPYGIAADAADNIYVTDIGAGGGVYKMANDGSGKTRVDDGLSDLAGVAIDGAGNVFVSSYTSNVLYELPVNGGPHIQLASGFVSALALAVDGAGNIYVGDKGLNTIYQVPPGGGSSVAIISGLNNVVGVAIDASYNIYLPEQGTSGINKFSPTGGYFISQPLPAGLSFDNTTGAITGMATTTSAEKQYIISAYNSAGGVSDTLGISILPPPVLTYAKPTTPYNTGTAITPLTPSATGVAPSAPGVYTTPVVLGSGLTGTSYGVTIDKAGNIYTVNSSTGDVNETFPDGTTTLIATGLPGTGITVDDNCNVYVAANSQVAKIATGGGSPVILNSGFTQATGVALDSSGKLYVADFNGGNATIYAMNNDGSGLTTYDSTIPGAYSLATDKADNLYIIDKTQKQVYEKLTNGGALSSLATGFVQPEGLAIDGFGNVYVQDAGNGNTYMVAAGGGARTLIANNITGSHGIAIDAASALYITDAHHDGVLKESPAGGYFINKALPAGLTFDGTTGAISGTPTAVAAEMKYIISAYNAGGGVSDTLRISVNGPAPVFSYTNPNVDTLGVTIDNIIPSTTGGDAPGFAPYKLIANGFLAPLGIASDAAGNIYVADKGNNMVKKVPANGGPTVSLGSGFSSPSGVAVDAAGFIYVADADNGEVKKMSADGTTITSIGAGFTSPVGVALDAAGNVYVADAGAGAVYKILASDGSTVVLSFDFTDPTSIAVDKTGKNIYVADGGANSVYKVSSGCGCPEDLGAYFNFPTAVALDPAGNVYVADVDYTNFVGQVYKSEGGSADVVSIGSSFVAPTGVAVDPSGNLFVTDAATGILYRVTPSGGYFLADVLPKGLKLNDTTGVISGKPAELSAAADYRVFAYNANGGAPAAVNIEVVLPPAPTVSYNALNTYVAGTAITQLSPASTYVAAPAYADTPVVIGAGFNAPRGTAVDKSGNVFVADSLNNAVKMIPAGGGTPVPWGSGFSAPNAVAVDSLGFVYVSDYGNQAIKKIGPDGTTVTSIATIAQPSAIAVDSALNVYATDLNTGFVYKIKASDGSMEPMNHSFAFPYPTGVATDGKHVFVSDGFFGAVIRLTPGVSIPDINSDFIGPFNYPAGVAVDGGGNIYISDEGDSTIYRASASGSSLIALSTTGFSGNEGLSVDGKGNLYVADVNNNVVTKVTPTGGFYIDKGLPPGLSFNGRSGAIHGTPISASSAKNYTVTGYNAAGPTASQFSIEVGLPPPPILSYPGPNVYTIGVAIPTLTPSIANTSAINYNGPGTTVSSGYAFISGVATDKAGNVYIADVGANAVFKLPPGGLGSPVSIGSGFDEPQNVAVDTAGNVYVADAGNGAIKKIPHGTGTPVTIASGFDYPVGVAVDAAGNVYIAVEGSYGAGALYKLTGGAGTPVRMANADAIVDPVGVAVDGAGNVFVLDADSEKVYELAGGTGTPVHVGPWLNGGGAISVDNGGNLYVTDAPLSRVYVIPADGSTTRTISQVGLSFGVAVDGSGNLYVTDPLENTLQKVAPAGGLFLKPALPAGLVFNSSNGAITGIPQVQSPATDYSVNAYNYGGAATATVNIKVRSNIATLASLTTSLRPVSPVFKTATTTYTTSPLPFSAASIKITAKPTDSSAVMTARMNGGGYITLNKGVPSDDLALNTGANTLEVLVTSEDGTVTKTYTVTINRQATAILNSIAYNPSITKTKVAGSNYADYTATVNSSVSSVTVTPVAQDPAAVIKVNGQTVASGSTSDPVTLQPGNTTINTVVMASDGSVTNTYSIVISRPGNALLTALTYNPPLTTVKVAGAHDFDYTATVYKALNSITVTPVTADPAATVTVNGNPVTSGTPSDPVTLNPGPNVINTVVTAADGVTTKTYSITINRIPNALLTSLTYSPSIIKTQVSGTHDFDYTAMVKSSVTSISVTPVTQDATSTVTVNGEAVSSGSSSSPIALNAGPNTITTVVTASDGTTTKTYSIVITREADALLTSLTYDPSLTTVKVAGTHDFDYTATVYKALSAISVTPVANDPGATIKVNGETVVSGHASNPVPLVPGPNQIITVVTAADGHSTKTYSIVITRAPNALLATLTYSPTIVKTLVTGSNYADYTATVKSTVTSVTVTPVAQDATSTIKVNGQTVASGAASAPIMLNAGTNTINTVVTASDGVTSNTYSIVITRQADAFLSSLTYSPALTALKVTGTHDFDYTARMKTSSVQVIPVADDPSATIKVNGVIVASGATSPAVQLAIGANVINTVVTATDGTTKTYSITINREPNALLATLAYNPASIRKVKVAGTNYVDYTATVANILSTVTVTPVTQDPTSTVTVNGEAVASGGTSGPIMLNVGNNTINTVVTAADGATTNTYSIVITRQSPTSGVMAYEEAKESPVIATLLVHQNVSPNGDGNSDVLKIDNITDYPDNKLQIMSRGGELIYEASGYDNYTKAFDGHSNSGKLQQAGTYFYSLDYKDGTQTKRQTGFIVLKY